MARNSLIVLAVLYAAFVSLGLPDQAFGVAWPFMRQSFDLPLDRAGIVVSLGSIIGGAAGFASGWFIRRWPTSQILIASALLTASAMLGYGLAPGFAAVIAATVVSGSGAGTIDAALNNYVAENYSSRHLIWLHGFYGIGAAAGPAIMSMAVAHGENWRAGYIAIALIQFMLAVVFMLTAGVWKKSENASHGHFATDRNYRLWSPAPLMVMGVFMIESTICSCIGVWFYSLLVEERRISPGVAGMMSVLYWSSMTAGRFALGFWAPRLSNRTILRCSLTGLPLGLLLLFADNIYLTAAGLLIAGVSLSGLYPTLMHETPRRFGSEFAKVMTGYQAGASMAGAAVLFPLIGVWLDAAGLNLLPWILSALALTAYLFTAKVYKI